VARIQELAASAEDQLKMSRQLIEPLEWGGLAFQGAVLVQTSLADPFGAAARGIVIALGLSHLALAVVIWRTKGPIVRGGLALGAWLAAALAIPVVIALLAAPGTYADNTACVPGCTYPSAPLFFVTLSPRIVARALPRRAVGAGLLGAVCAEWLLLTYAINGRFTTATSLSVMSSIILALIAYGLAEVEAGIAGVIRRSQTEARQQKNDEFFDFLHSHIKAGLSAVRLAHPDIEAMLEKVGELERTVSEHRMAYLLSADRVPLATLCSERVRAFTGIIAIAETPRIGPRTVAAPVGILIDRALGDLLKNAVLHGASTAWVRMTQQDELLVIEIGDDGPGFDESVMDNTGTSLYRLRASARERGGDLRRLPRSPRGSTLVLTVRTE
jgi:signal transduction histidine kinase